MLCTAGLQRLIDPIFICKIDALKISWIDFILPDFIVILIELQ